MEIKVIIPLLRTSCLDGHGFTISLKPNKAHPTSLAREWSTKGKPDKRDGQTCLKWEPVLMAEQLDLGKTPSTTWKANQSTWPLHHHELSRQQDSQLFLDYSIEMITMRHPIYTETLISIFINEVTVIICCVMWWHIETSEMCEVGGDERDLFILEMKRDSSNGESKKRWLLTSWDSDDAQ